MIRRDGEHDKPRLALALTLTLGAAACMPTQGLPGVTTPPVTTGKAVRAGAPPSSGASPAMAAAKHPSTAPFVPMGTPTPAASSAPTPAPTPLPSPPVGLTTAHAALKPLLEQKLLAIAKVGFTNARANLISNNGGGIISNNSAGIISNASGGIISNNGAGYRVAQSAEGISFAPLAGEELAFDFVWPDDSRYRTFRPAGATDYATTRQVYAGATGEPTKELFRKVSEVFPDGTPKVYDEAKILQTPEGRVLVRFGFSSVNSAPGVVGSFAVLAGTSRYQDTATGVDIQIAELAQDYGTDSGHFRYVYPLLGQTETGTLTHMRKEPDGTVTVRLLDPLAYSDGESRTETTDGKLLYTRRVETTPETRVTTYDLLGGMVVRLDHLVAGDEAGTLLVDGKPEAGVRLELRADGSRIFIVTFAEDPTHPVVVGYGIVDSAVVGSPPPSPPVWKVLTVAGAEAGNVDGPGAAARFKNLTALVPSRATPGRFYLVDGGNHTVRTMDVADSGAVTIATYAGTGAAGAAEGPRLQAAFNGPFGLAADADDTLYVSEISGNKIRKIAPDGTVSTFAGSGSAGFKEAQGLAAWFYQPAGLAIAPDQSLYVAEYGSQLIRKVAPDGTTSTVAGGMYKAGAVDATGAAARFNHPLNLAFDATGALIVADRDNKLVRKVTLAGDVSTVGGGADAARFFWDGPAREIALGFPRAVAFDPAGRLYVGSTNVRMQRDDGRLTSYAGQHLTRHADGNQDTAFFTNIEGMAFGPRGVLYVADGTRVRAIVPPVAPAP